MWRSPSSLSFIVVGDAVFIRQDVSSYILHVGRTAWPHKECCRCHLLFYDYSHIFRLDKSGNKIKALEGLFGSFIVILMQYFQFLKNKPSSVAVLLLHSRSPILAASAQKVLPLCSKRQAVLCWLTHYALCSFLLHPYHACVQCDYYA